ncbi:MAG: hypothetical protein N3A63_08415 [Bacteroidetes bacterium]|nr:hypothetical protein [Bacteroidota bacterium]
MVKAVHIDWKFVRWVVLCFTAAGILTYYPISEFATPHIVRSILAGGCMSFFNILLGYVAIEVGFEKSHTVFLKIILGSMIVRLLLMWGILLLLIKQFGFHAASLMLSLLFFYVMTLVLEILYLQKRIAVKK